MNRARFFAPYWIQCQLANFRGVLGLEGFVYAMTDPTQKEHHYLGGWYGGFYNDDHISETFIRRAIAARCHAGEVA